MTSPPPVRPGRGRPARTALVAAIAFAGVTALPALAHAASPTTLYASPGGNGTACSAAAPCSLAQARSSVEAIDGGMSGNIVVRLAGGTYRLSAPLTFGAADSGGNGYTVTWQAAPGAAPVMTCNGGGNQQWTLG